MADTTSKRSSAKKPWVIGAALGAAGLMTGAILAGSFAAQAADNTTTPSPSSSVSAPPSVGGNGTAGNGTARNGNDSTDGAPQGQPPAFPGNGNTDPSKPMRSDETLLTGDTKAKVEAAVAAKYPDATIQRTETDSDGVYESHIVTKAGVEMIVQVGKDFTITGTQTGGPGGPGGHGDNDGDGPGAPPAGAGNSGTGSSAQSSSANGA